MGEDETVTGTEGMEGTDVAPSAEGGVSAEVVEYLREHPFPRATPHPLLPWFTEVELAKMLERGKEGELVELYRERERRILLTSDEGAKGYDPYRLGFELEHWVEADRDLKVCGKGQYVAGGKRATKSERAAKRLVRAALRLPGLICWAFQGELKTSIATQQRLVWKYLPPEMRALNSRARRGVTKINYSQDGGFTEQTFVLPNRSQVWFMTYKQETKDYQGWELGARLTPVMEEMIAQDPQLFNLGAWLDEDAPLEWVETVEARCTTRRAVWMWTFSTLEGITTAIKSILGTPKTVKSRRAALLPAHRRYVDDCPVGEVPYVQRPGTRGGISVMYFHTDLNPFPPSYAEMAALAKGRPDGWVLENLYGWSTDTRHRAFPNFGPLNIIEAEELPAVGTNYRLLDPAGDRNCYVLWVRVAPGKPRRFYIYREWPDAAHYGAWAVPSKDPLNFDGDAGPAQRNLGYGVHKYKELILSAERIRKMEDGRWEMDPQRRAIQERLKEGECAQEEIAAGYIDPRAGRNQALAEQRGGECLIDKFLEKTKDQEGRELGPMLWLPAPGLHIQDGLGQVNDLLEWDRNRERVAILNEPRLYVVRECQQVIWTLENYTNTGGEKAGGKDPADLLRYMATAGLRHVEKWKGTLMGRTWGY